MYQDLFNPERQSLHIPVLQVVVANSFIFIFLSDGCSKLAKRRTEFFCLHGAKDAYDPLTLPNKTQLKSVPKIVHYLEARYLFL